MNFNIIKNSKCYVNLHLICYYNYNNYKSLYNDIINKKISRYFQGTLLKY